MNQKLASLAVLLLSSVPAVALAQQPTTGTTDDLAPPPPGATDNTGTTHNEMAAPPATTPAPAPAPVPDTTYAPPPPPSPPPSAPPPSGAYSPQMGGGLSAAQAQELLEQQRRRKIHIIYIEATAGAHWMDMATVHQDNFLPPMTVQTSGTGGTGGIAAGVRLADFIAIGARGTLGFFPTFNFGIAAPEVSLILTTPVVEVYLRAGFGYAWVGNANIRDISMGTTTTTSTTIYGFAFTSSLGLDVYLSDAISIGAAFDLDVMNMSRQALTGSAVIMATSVDLTKDGNAVGVHTGGHAAITLHFL